MGLLRGQDIEQQQQIQQIQPMHGQIPQQPQQPQTLMQRAIKREKWILVFCGVLGIVGMLEAIFTDRETFSNVFTGTLFLVIFLSIANFTLVPYLQNIFFQSKRASEQFWDQKF